MKKIFAMENYKFYLYDTPTSIIYNNENLKNKIIDSLIMDKFLVIDSKVIESPILVSQFLKNEGFNMRLVPYFKLNNFLHFKLSDLKIEDLIYLKILIFITSGVSVIIFDDVLTYLNDEYKEFIINYLSDNDIKYINFTSDIEEVFLSKYLIVLSKNGVAIEGSTKSVLKEEKILKRLGFSLPVIYDISRQLKDYKIIEKEYYDLEKLVTNLWK